MSVIFPGAVKTEITANSGIEMKRTASSGKASRLPMTEPADAARMIVDGIEEDKLHIYVGRDSRILNLLTRVAPRKSTHLIARQMESLLS